jgi:tetratricopeptide (TPR) repeat protein
VADGRWADAGNLFERAIADSQSSRRDRRAVLEEYAKFLDRKKDYPKAHDTYRDLLRQWPHELHNYRRFAASLSDAAGAAKASGNPGTEDACFHEAQQVLRKLLEIAPHDQWAAEILQRVQHRMY